MNFGGSGSVRGKVAAAARQSTDDSSTVEPECDVVLTRDHEYFVLKGVCIAVRERASGRFVRQDLSIGVASIHPREVVRGMPRTGEWLCLERGGTLHYVGTVLGCERRRSPSRRIVAPVLRRANLD
jgi:hypothetical protein